MRTGRSLTVCRGLLSGGWVGVPVGCVPEGSVPEGGVPEGGGCVPEGGVSEGVCQRGVCWGVPEGSVPELGLVLLPHLRNDGSATVRGSLGVQHLMFIESVRKDI